MDQLIDIKHEHGADARIIAGNTEVGMFISSRMLDHATGIEQRILHKRHSYLVDISCVHELKHHHIDTHTLTIGAGHTLSEMKELCEKYAVTHELCHKSGIGGGALEQVLRMIRWFAGRHVRNVAVR